MIIQEIQASNCTPQTIVIGRRGTYDTMQIAFDLSFLIENYGSGTAVLAVKRSQDESAYPAVVTQEDSTLLWTVNETDTAYVGSGECQLMWYVDGGLAKTIIYPIVVMRDILSTAEEPPDGYENWIERLTELGAETQQNAQNAAQSASDASTAKDDAVTAKEAAEAAQEAAETAVTHYPKIENNYWMVWDVASQSYVSTGIKAEGEDGYSPEISITTIPGGHRVTITDKDHPQGQTFDVMDGQGGSTGDYDELTNRPRINGHTLTGNQSASDLGLGTYSKPASGIPKTDLASDVKASLGKADTALQTAPVTSVNSKTGAVTLGAGDIGFNSSEEYNEGTVGAKLSALNRQLSDKQDAPATAGTAGQVLGLDSNLDPVWLNPSGGVADAGDISYDSTETYQSGTVGAELESINGRFEGLEAADTGSILTIEDTSVKAVDISVELPYKETGYTCLRIATAKSNMLDFSGFQSVTNITVDTTNKTVKTSGSNRGWYTGTASSTATTTFPTNSIDRLTFLKAGTYVLAATNVAGNAQANVFKVNEDGTMAFLASGNTTSTNAISFTLNEDAFVNISTPGGTGTYGSIRITPDTKGVYEDYAGRRYKYAFGETIYGGTVAISATGNITITSKYASDGTELSTPDVITISGNDPVMLLENETVIWAMYGNISVTVSATVKEYVDSVIDSPNAFVRLKVMEYNVGRYNWGNHETKLTEEQYQQYILPWKRFIAQSGADIIATTEDDRYIDADSLHPSSEIYMTFPYQQNNYGATCIKSKYQLKNKGIGTFVSSSREYSYATINVNGHDIYFISLHLKNGDAVQHYETRQAEYAELVQLVSDKEYYIVAGDFNCQTYDTAEFALFTGAVSLNGSNYCGRYGTTPAAATDYDDPTLGEALDNIFVSPNIKVEYYHTERVYADLTSDHIPFTAGLLIY